MPLTRRLILQKARHHTIKSALTDCKHTVSGTISLPSRGTFHHSLTVLFTIGYQEVFRLTKWSWQIHTGFHEPRATRAPNQTNAHMNHLRDYHALRSTIPGCSTPRTHQPHPPAKECVSCLAPQHRMRNPRWVSHTHGLAIIRFRSPLLTEYLFLWVLRCFTSPRSSHTGYLTHQQVTPHYRCWVPPFRNPRINTRSSTPRGISQTATSFISS